MTFSADSMDDSGAIVEDLGMIFRLFKRASSTASTVEKRGRA
jgi:hypothetical protein